MIDDDDEEEKEEEKACRSLVGCSLVLLVLVVVVLVVVVVDWLLSLLIIVILAIWDYCCGWIDVFMIDSTSLASILLVDRGIYKKESDRIITLVKKNMWTGCCYVIIISWFGIRLQFLHFDLSQLYPLSCSCTYIHSSY